MEPGESREVEAWGKHVVNVDKETVCLQRGAVSEGKQGNYITKGGKNEWKVRASKEQPHFLRYIKKKPRERT